VKLGIMFSNVGFFGLPDHLVNLARTAEENGFESLWTVEHVVVPKGYQARYPYSKDGRMPGPEDAPIPDPLMWLAYAAAVTERIRLATGILILPQRHPFYVAKEVATLDQLSRGRAMLGVGIGWLEEEFRALGIPFDERVGRTEESVRALRELWKPGPASFAGEHYRFDPVESNPKPVQEGGVPVVVGGHVPGAARRAARLGDGFFPATSERLPRLLEVLREECDRLGRDPAEIEITTGTGSPSLDEVRRLEDLGVSRLVVAPPAFDPEGVRKGLGKIGDEIIARS